MDLAQEVLKYTVCSKCRKADSKGVLCDCGADLITYESILAKHGLLAGEKREHLDSVVRQYRKTSNKPFWLAIIDFQKAFGVKSQFYPLLYYFLKEVGLSAPRKPKDPVEEPEATVEATQEVPPDPIHEPEPVSVEPPAPEVVEPEPEPPPEQEPEPEPEPEEREPEIIAPAEPVIQAKSNDVVPLAMLYVELAFAQALSNSNSSDLGKMVRFAANGGQIRVTDLAEHMGRAEGDTVDFITKHAKAPWSRYASIGLSDDHEYVYCELKRVRTIGEVMMEINKANRMSK